MARQLTTTDEQDTAQNEFLDALAYVERLAASAYDGRQQYTLRRAFNGKMAQQITAKIAAQIGDLEKLSKALRDADTKAAGK